MAGVTSWTRARPGKPWDACEGEQIDWVYEDGSVCYSPNSSDDDTHDTHWTNSQLEEAQRTEWTMCTNEDELRMFDEW